MEGRKKIKRRMEREIKTGRGNSRDKENSERSKERRKEKTNKKRKDIGEERRVKGIEWRTEEESGMSARKLSMTMLMRRDREVNGMKQRKR